MEVMFCFIATYVYAVLMYVFICQLVPGAVPFWKILLILPTIHIATTLKMLCSAPWSYVCSGSVIIASLVAYAFLFFRERRGQVLLYSAAFWGMKMVSDAVACRVVASAVGNGENFAAGQMPICTVMGWSIFVLLGAGCVVIFRMVTIQSLHSFCLPYLLFPFSHTILVVWSVLGIQNWVWILGAGLGLCAELALLSYTVAQEQKDAMEEELKDVLHLLELERVYYNSVEERQKELSCIRHDFNNQLSAILLLLHQGEQEDAQRMIRHLADQIDGTCGNLYCGIPVVDAVLIEKDRESRKIGVNLRVELRMPPDIKVEPLDLCSVFTNLLDNAIRAAKDSGVEEPEVRLTAAMEGDYLFIKTVNPAPESEKKKKRQGYGISILKNLAGEYKGIYQGGYKDGIYTAVVSLLAN